MSFILNCTRPVRKTDLPERRGECLELLRYIEAGMGGGVPVSGGTGLGDSSQHSGQKAALCRTPFPEICNAKRSVLPSFLVAMYIHRAISCLKKKTYKCSGILPAFSMMPAVCHG